MAGSPPRKRQRLTESSAAQASDVRAKRAGFLSSLTRTISPPPNPSTPQSPPAPSNQVVDSKDLLTETKCQDSSAISRRDAGNTERSKSATLPSPIHLTRIRGLPASDNVDTVSLHDILSDPLIKEAWIFNYCFDVDWLMQHFDPDIRNLVNVKIIHGSWRREDMNRVGIDDACSRMDNVQAIQAYLPDQFGTHHSKMFVLFRHDDSAQVIIHTANMLEKDWSNMTQAVWKSPPLPLSIPKTGEAVRGGMVGSGDRFKHDLLRYLKAYGNKLRPLTQQLTQYDFSEVRGAIIASVPSKLKVKDEEVWGHLSLRRAIAEIGSAVHEFKDSYLVCQISSIATLTATWLDETIFKAAGIPPQTSSKASSFTTNNTSLQTSIIFPTSADVAASLDGYYGGGSIHTKAQSAAHLKQIDALRPHLHRWTENVASSTKRTNALRHAAAPHIKTYISFAAKPTITVPMPAINWALLSSANLSQQAWGTAPKLAKGEKDSGEATVHIQSFEIGVLIWPQLFGTSFGRDVDKRSEVDCNRSNEMPDGAATVDSSATKIKMVPVFGKDMPHPDFESSDGEKTMLIGFRMPYNLPLVPYGPNDLPWSPQSTYTQPDRHGRRWPPGESWMVG